MSVRQKSFIPDNIYFITFTILDWKIIFTNDKYCDLIYKWFDYIKEKYGNKIYGYAIMPNHIHCIIYISDQSPALSKLIQNAKRFLAYQIVDLLERDCKTLRGSPLTGDSRGARPSSAAGDSHEAGTGACGAEVAQDSKIDLLNFFQSKAEVLKGAKHKVFEDGFDSKPIYSSDFFLEKLDYIHKNPCSKKWKLAENIEDYKYSSAMNYLSGLGFYEVEVIQPY